MLLGMGYIIIIMGMEAKERIKKPEKRVGITKRKATAYKCEASLTLVNLNIKKACVSTKQKNARPLAK